MISHARVLVSNPIFPEVWEFVTSGMTQTPFCNRII